MKILLTGGSSFTGCWFARELAAAGHDVTVTHRAASYPGVRQERVALVAEVCQSVHGVAFGDDAFVELVRNGGYDLLCVHGARVEGYRDPSFDVAGALAENTRRVNDVVPHVPRVMVTGSVFEPGVGEGDAALPAFSPYGLSKAFTAETFRYWCGRHGVSFSRFVIPNPFGPLEDARFTASLVAAWRRGETPQVRTPEYVRDNIHVSLLARTYADFAGRLPEGGWTGALGPSGYREPQGVFAQRFAAEMGARLGLETPLELLAQTDWSEPAVRLNTDVVDAAALGWDEAAAWDELVAWYRA
jgi:UDP-glucose 4-epimerase